MAFKKTYAVDVAATFAEYPYAKSFQRIMAIFDDKATVDGYLKELNGQIKKKVDKHKKDDPNYSEAQALYDIFRSVENDEGFHKTQVCYVTGVLSPDKFLKMMKGKMAFLDPFVTNRHGAETHRIQWWMIAQDMAANKALYDAGQSASDLFMSTAGVGAYIGPNNNVWYHALDALQGKCDSARAPESLKEYIGATPAYSLIAAAEANQMRWDTCIKLPHKAATTLGPVKAKMEKNWELKKYG